MASTQARTCPAKFVTKAFLLTIATTAFNFCSPGLASFGEPIAAPLGRPQEPEGLPRAEIHEPEGMVV